MSLLDQNDKILVIQTNYNGTGPHVMLDNEANFDIENDEGKLLGTICIHQSSTKIHNSDNSVFMSLEQIKSFLGIKGYDLRDSENHLIAKMRDVGKIIPHAILQNSKDKEILALKGRKTIQDVSGNIIAELSGISVSDLFYKKDRPWTLSIHDLHFDRLMLLGFFFSLYTINYVREMGTGGAP